jgi:fructokinase
MTSLRSLSPSTRKSITVRRVRPTIVCFGEVMWDCVPRGLFLGGAPVNVAWHLCRQGVRALPVTGIGRDFLGAEMRRRLIAGGVDLRFVTETARWPTGTVQASLDDRGVPAFHIARGVAWDHIGPQPAIRGVSAPDAVIYGTLALREKPNRRSLAALLRAWPAAWRVVDLNLRPPFDTATAIDLVLGEAQLLKLNEHELARLDGRSRSSPAGLEQSARRIASRHGISRICVTAGDRGAGLLWDDDWRWESARPAAVRDTIGAGDAFLAGLLAALLVRRQAPPQALMHACRMGEFVAARDGSMPLYHLNSRGQPREFK